MVYNMEKCWWHQHFCKQRIDNLKIQVGLDMNPSSSVGILCVTILCGFGYARALGSLLSS
jgi:hypothetical protein